MSLNLSAILDPKRIYRLHHISGISCFVNNSPQTMAEVIFLRVKEGVELEQLQSSHLSDTYWSLFDKYKIVLVNYDLIGGLTIGDHYVNGIPIDSFEDNYRDIKFDLNTISQAFKKCRSNFYRFNNYSAFQITIDNTIYFFPYFVLQKFFVLRSSEITKWLYHSDVNISWNPIYKYIEDFEDEKGNIRPVIKLGPRTKERHRFLAAEILFNDEARKNYLSIYKDMVAYRSHYHQKEYEDPNHLISEYNFPKFTFPAQTDYEFTIKGFNIKSPQNKNVFWVTKIITGKIGIDLPDVDYAPAHLGVQNADDKSTLKPHNYGRPKEKPIDITEKPLDTETRPSSSLSQTTLHQDDHKYDYINPPISERVLYKATTTGKNIKNLEEGSTVSTGQPTGTNAESQETRFQEGPDNNPNTAVKETDVSIHSTDSGLGKRFENLIGTINYLKKISSKEYPDFYFERCTYLIRSSSKRYNRYAYYTGGSSREFLHANLEFKDISGVLHLLELDLMHYEAALEKDSSYMVDVPARFNPNDRKKQKSKIYRSPMSCQTLVIYDVNRAFNHSHILNQIQYMVDHQGQWNSKSRGGLKFKNLSHRFSSQENRAIKLYKFIKDFARSG